MSRTDVAATGELRKPTATPPPIFPLRVDRVSVSFHTTDGVRPVLSDVSFTIERGEWLAVTGPNGSGKSTLGRVLAGLLATSRGKVRFAGGAEHPSTQAQGKAQAQPALLSDHVQLVFQNPDAQIVGATVEEDLRFGLENRGVPGSEAPARMELALQRAGLSLPLDQPTDTLSGGQKQRLAVASALAVDVPVLVFDEPTSMLDPAHQRHLLSTVRQLCADGHAVVWITQRLEELAAADQVLALSGGQVAFSGDPRSFFSGPCQEIGFPLPYIAAVAQACATRGLLTAGALTVESLVESLVKAVSSSCR